jgi:polyisoprenoid-binding protein YceI
MRLLLCAIALFALNLQADCLIKKEDVKVEFVAFKTPLKVGVKGWFEELGIEPKYTGKNLKSLLSNVSFDINTNSVATGNKDRDKKIATSFFGKN